MFPAGLESRLHRGEDYEPGAFFCYADQETFFFLNGGEFGGWGQLRSKWTFDLGKPFQIGLRQADRFEVSQPHHIPSDLFLGKQSHYGWAKTIPSPGIWQRVATAFMDGWLTWAGSPSRLLDDAAQLDKLSGMRGWVPALEKSGIDLGRKSEVRIEGGYLGGRFNTMHATTAWIADAE
jgi:hypothetical protein